MIDIGALNLQYVTDITGKPSAAIIPIKEFQELLEDISDLAAIAERRDEPTISHQTLLAELKAQG